MIDPIKDDKMREFNKQRILIHTLEKYTEAYRINLKKHNEKLETKQLEKKKRLVKKMEKILRM